MAKLRRKWRRLTEVEDFICSLIGLEDVFTISSDARFQFKKVIVAEGRKETAFFKRLIKPGNAPPELIRNRR
jgi:hypothetical protein